MSEIKFLKGEYFTHSPKNDGKQYEYIDLKLGRHHTERYIPPAGEEYAFEYEAWDHTLQVCISPSGRSVQVFFDNKKIV